jgi:predicted alpha/beta hydrolase
LWRRWCRANRCFRTLRLESLLETLKTPLHRIVDKSLVPPQSVQKFPFSV